MDHGFNEGSSANDSHVFTAQGLKTDRQTVPPAIKRSRNVSSHDRSVDQSLMTAPSIEPSLLAAQSVLAGLRRGLAHGDG